MLKDLVNREDIFFLNDESILKVLILCKRTGKPSNKDCYQSPNLMYCKRLRMTLAKSWMSFLRAHTTTSR